MTRPSRPATRIAFLVIAVFVIAQVAWWIVFQQRYTSEIGRERIASWQRDAETATELLSSGGIAPQALLARYPHLQFDEERLLFVTDPDEIRALEREQRRVVRMFAFEGPFFVLVVLSLLVFINLNLRAERDLKRRQQNFLSAVTHEFKTPLSTLRLLVQTTRMRRIDEERLDDYLERMEGELDRLERTSEQVLASARLEQTREAPLLAATELNRVVAALLEGARPGLEARGADITLRSSAQPLPVSLDERAFELVLGNLLDNAVKYSPDAHKPVVVTLEGEGDLVLLHVDDLGRGLDGSSSERIFERFYRSGDELTREAPGVGLGLHLVRSITEAMNGWVRAGANPAGRGARFTVVLPRRIEAPSRERGLERRPA